MIRHYLLTAFSCAVLFSAWAADPIYIQGEWDGGFFDSYFYPSSDFVSPPYYEEISIPFPNDYPSGSFLYVLSPEDYFSDLDSGWPSYMPFSSDPVYSSSVPSGPPSGGSSGGGGSGGGGDGAFDPVGSFGGLSSLLSGVGLGVAALALSGVGFVSSFLVYRKIVDSSKNL